MPRTNRHTEPSDQKTGSQLNWLRASVLGANDGIVSVAGLVVGVAGATTEHGLIVAAGTAGLLAGALSMAAGEYVSVSSQRDTERAILDKERGELRDTPKAELAELTELYRAKGLSRSTAQTVARELTDHDALAAHAETELHIDPHDLINPWNAALASALAFSIGGVIPLATIAITPETIRVPATFAAVLTALVITGCLSAWAGGAKPGRAIVRVILGGTVAMLITYSIGRLFHVHGV